MAKIDQKNSLFVDCNKVNEVFSNFFNNSPITFFEYAKFSIDGEVTLLSTHPNFTNVIFENDLNFTQDQLSKLNRYNLINSNHIPDNVEFKKYDMLANLSRINFNIDHFLCISTNSHGFHELFSFGAKSNDKMAIDFYLNNLDFLENFISHFNENLKNIQSGNKTDNHIVLKNFDSHHNDNLFQIIHKNNHPILRYGNEINEQLPKRQKECLLLTAQGYSAKEIAKFLTISPRTVESYIEELKKKFCIKKKSALWKILQPS